MSHITTRTLDSGLSLVVERMPQLKSAALAWILPCGCAHDPLDKQGLSAMWSELLLRGAGSLDSRAHADALDRLGASRSTNSGAFTFSITSSMIGERLGGVLPLLVDMVRAPRIAEDAIEPARDLCVQAIESLQDDPQERAVLEARHRHFPDPLGRSGLGTIEGLASLTRADLHDRWHALAKPKGSILAAAGDVDAAKLADVLESLLSGWIGATTEPKPGPTPARGYAHTSEPSNQVQIIVVHDAPPETDATGNPNRAALLEKFAIAVLSGGMSSRLFTHVRERKGLCYSVSAGYRGDRDFGAVTAYVGTTPDKAQDSLDTLLEQLREINPPRGAITPEEFQRASIGMKSGIVFSGESSAARASALAIDQRRFARPRSLDEILAMVNSVTLDEVNAYLTTRTLGTLTIQTLGPKPLRPPQ